MCDSNIEKSAVEKQTLDAEKGVTVETSNQPDLNPTKEVEHSPDNATLNESPNSKIVEEVLNSLKESAAEVNVVPDVPTSLAQDGSTARMVDSKEGSVPDTPTLSEDPQNQEILDDKGEKHEDLPAGEGTDKSESEDRNVVDLDDFDSMDQTLSEVAGGSIAKRLRNKKGKVVATSTTPTKTPKGSSVGPKKGWSKVSVTYEKQKKILKRKEAPTSDSDYDVEEDVPNIISTTKKKVGGKFIPKNVADAPMDNVSFHSVESVQRWKYVFHRRLALERELGKEALECQEIVELIKKAGLMKTVWGIGDCYPKLVKKFLVNIHEDYDNPFSKEYQQVYVRGKRVEFSPAVINKFLERGLDDCTIMEAGDNVVCQTITAKQVKVWPKKGKVPSVMLSVKYAILNRIGAVNWVPTTHSSDIATGLAKFIYIVGTETRYDFGKYIFDQTVKHAKTLAVKMPVAFPSLLCSIIIGQHPGILVSSDVAIKRESPLTLHAKLFEGKHVADFVGTSSKAASVTMNRKEMIASLEATCKDLEERKLSLEQVIQALKREEEAEVKDGAEEGGEASDDGGDTEELDHSEEEA
jgi:hypothetical protein